MPSATPATPVTPAMSTTSATPATTTTPVTPADVLARRSQLILSGDADGFAALFAPDAVIESTFAGRPGAPLRLRGQEAIREYSRRVLASPLRLEVFEVAALHQTQDPELVITEMRTRGTVATTGQPFTTTSVQIIRIREGHIVHSRDFADPRLLEHAVGGHADRNP